MSPHEIPSAEKWTEIEHLPDWDEEYYDVYTGKKYGKWLMFKTLKKEYRDQPEYRVMMDKEFDVRYNLAHPHIIMINDYEDVPGVGRCIITDDVYGDSLRKLIDTKAVTPGNLDKITHQLVDAMEYIQNNHLVHSPIRPETVIFTEKIGNLKLINVGYEQRNHLSHADTSRDIQDYGKLLLEVIETLPDQNRYSSLKRIAQRCMNPDASKRYRDVQHLKLAIAGRSSRTLAAMILAFIALMLAFIALAPHLK